MSKFIKVKILFLLILNSVFWPFLGEASSPEEELRHYLASISSVLIEFEQSDQYGQKAKGALIINKPYKFRCNYYAPFPLLIIGGKDYVSVYDYEMHDLSRVKAKENIFYSLLLNDVKGEGNFSIQQYEKNGDLAIFTVYSRQTDKISKLTFEDKTKELKLLKIFEEDNIITLRFDSLQKLDKVNKKLFLLQDPDIFGPPKRLNSVKEILAF
jgi:outer membrane lipoprotein-sorting protein